MRTKLYALFLTVFILFLATSSRAQSSSFCNTGRIIIPALGSQGPAHPYPSEINVSGLPGTITRLTVSLFGYSHTYTGDVRMVLETPYGQTIQLVNRAGGSTHFVNVNLTYDDLGIFAPLQPLALTIGSNPNGTWKLYVDDLANADAGEIAGGWCLNIETSSPSQPPVITCPGNLVVSNDANTCGAIVNFTGSTAATATGDPAPTISYSPSSGSLFPVGTTLVTATATSTAGASTCTFNVIVRDEQRPTITCPNLAPSYPVNNFGCSYKVSGTGFDPIASDNCPGVIVSNNWNNSNTLDGASFPKGSTTVVWTVTDAAGNTATCTTTVHVVTNLSASIADASAQTPSAGLNVNTIYYGYAPASSLTLTASPSAGIGGYSYSWSTSPNGLTSSPVASHPEKVQLHSTTAGAYNVTATITDGQGCSATVNKAIFVVDVRSGKNMDKVTVCHKGKDQSVGTESIQNHLNHGDKLGTCSNSNASSTQSVTKGGEEVSPLEDVVRTIQSGKVSPNPTRGILTVVLKEAFAKGEIAIVDINGRLIERRTITGQNQVFDLSKQASGIYFIKVQSGKSLETMKVLVQR